jgi:hypothetical protein
VIKIFWLFTGFLVCISPAQDYLWPVKAGRYLTAVFGEERPGRYHTGIDVRTFGNIGYELVAIEDGYISRIRTSSKGYGKTIYITLIDDNTAVYAHLDHFTPEIDNLVNALHEYYGKYTIDHKIDSREYPVKKGDLVGYSGDTGGVSGPHLHFEIRNPDEQPINPFQSSLNVNDNHPPIVQSIAFIPLDANAAIGGFTEQRVYPLKKLSETEYVLEDTIYLAGNIGLAVQAYDRMTEQFFNFGIHSANLLVDAQFIYSMQYDEINWENASKLYTEKNYSLARLGYGKFYHLFSHHESKSLPFINSKSREGFNFKRGGPHDTIINVQDYAGNKTEVKTYIYSDQIPEYDYSVKFEKNRCTISFGNAQDFVPYFYLTGKFAESTRKSPDYYEMGNNVYIIDNLIKPYDVIEIYAKDSKGVSSIPSFHAMPDTTTLFLGGEFQLNQYDYGTIFRFTEESFSGLNAFLSMRREGVQHKYPLQRKSKLDLVSALLPAREFLNVDHIKVYYESPTPIEIFQMDLSGAIVSPDTSFTLNLMDDEIRLSGNPHTFYDSVHVWVSDTQAPPPDEGKIIKGPYLIEPGLIPYNKEIKLDISLEKVVSKENLGIYYFSKKTEKWNYLTSQLVDGEDYISTTILSGEMFAVIRESTAPVISNLIPDVNGTYFSKDLEHISFKVEDSFSGVEGETDVIVKIDGREVVFEYNSYQKKVRYPLKYNLKKGTHSLYVQAADKVGNLSKIEGEFLVK